MAQSDCVDSHGRTIIQARGDTGRPNERNGKFLATALPTLTTDLQLFALDFLLQFATLSAA